MEISSDLKEFFNLESQIELFTEAISPRSCNGGEKFEVLALIGDKLLDLALIFHFTKEGLIAKGELRDKIKSVHNRWTLRALAEIFKIRELMKPADKNHVISQDELKECIEALIGANFEAYQYKNYREIVKKLLDIVNQRDLYDYDPIGQLNRLFPEENTKEIIQTTEKEPLIFRSTINKKYKNEIYEIISQDYPSKEEAERDAAIQFLRRIGIDIMDNFLKLSIKKNDESMLIASESYNIQEIVFKKSDYLDTIKVKPSPGPNETIFKYAERKIKKNPLYILVALSAWLEEIEISHWISEPSEIRLKFILMNLKLGNQSFFEFGSADSKVQANKMVANRLIETSQLLVWLKKYHINEPNF
ncbi:MAG: hypothetical protein KGD67_10740 [Candidatus Lokiarchaeota archaeon]|nr:hypothetical protein [Candidatus Lokiarchaeota archaeon]